MVSPMLLRVMLSNYFYCMIINARARQPVLAQYDPHKYAKKHVKREDTENWVSVAHNYLTIRKLPQLIPEPES